MSAGFVFIEDRKKDMILVSGFNVYPNEVESVAVTHPGVLEAAAIAQPDERSGEVVALFVVKKDPNLTEQELIEHCKKSLTGYKVPKHVYFRNELPKTNVGKILRRALRDELPKANWLAFCCFQRTQRRASQLLRAPLYPSVYAQRFPDGFPTNRSECQSKLRLVPARTV